MKKMIIYQKGVGILLFVCHRDLFSHFSRFLSRRKLKQDLQDAARFTGLEVLVTIIGMPADRGARINKSP